MFGRARTLPRRAAKYQYYGMAKPWFGIVLRLSTGWQTKPTATAFGPKMKPLAAWQRSMAAEMHSSFMALRKNCPMNTRKRFEGLKF